MLPQRIPYLALTLAAVLTSFVQSAGAQTDLPWKLYWGAPPECPDKNTIFQRIQKLLAQADGILSRGMHARAHISIHDDKYELRLNTESPSGVVGERILRADNCEQVASAAAVIIALAIDETTSTSPPSAAHQPPPYASFENLSDKSPEAALSSKALPETDREPTRDRTKAIAPRVRVKEKASPQPTAQPTRVTVGAGLVATWGALPRLAWGPAVSVDFRQGSWVAELHGVFFPAKFAGDPITPDKGGRVSLLAGGPRACFFIVGTRAISFGPCVTFEIGSMRGHGENLENTRRESVLWLAAGAGAQLEFSLLRHLVIQTRAGVQVPLQRFAFSYQRQDGSSAEVHLPTAASPRLAIFTRFSF